jgi:hypothetical protein
MLRFYRQPIIRTRRCTMIVSCRHCSRAVYLIGGQQGECPGCGRLVLNGDRLPNFNTAKAPSKSTHRNPEADKPSQRSETARATSTTYAPRVDPSKGKPGDHRPLGRRECFICHGQGRISGRTCSQCKGYGYERNEGNLTDVELGGSPSKTIAYASQGSPKKNPQRDAKVSRSATITPEVLPNAGVAVCEPRLFEVLRSGLAKVTPEIVAKAEKLIAQGWRPFEMTSGRLFSANNPYKTKRVDATLWSAIYDLRLNKGKSLKVRRKPTPK